MRRPTMTKVEELREDVFRRMEAIPRGDYSIIAGLKTLNIESQIDSLIAAARAEGFAEGVEHTTVGLALVEDAETFARGRAEGAEQERERIRKISRFLLANENVQEGFELCSGDEEYGSYIIVPTDNYRLVREMDMFPDVPASVLAPKEKP
jgi:hypothetical protein